MDKDTASQINRNDSENSNANIVFTIKDTNLYVPVVTLSENDNQNLLSLLSKGFGKLVYWNEYKTISENKDLRNGYRYFLKSNIVRVNRLFVMIFLKSE